MSEPTPPDHQAALSRLRDRLQPFSQTWYVASARGSAPDRPESPPGIVVMYHAASPEAAARIREMAAEAAPGVPVYSVPTSPAIAYPER